MAGVEDLAHPADTEADRVHLPRLHQHLLAESFAIPQPPWVVDQQDRATVGINITDTDNDVGVGSRGRDVELDLDRTGPLDGPLERFGGEGQDVVLLLETAGIAGSGEPSAGYRAGLIGVAVVTGRCADPVGHVRLGKTQSSFVLQKVGGGPSRRRKIVGLAPGVPRGIGLTHRSHHIIAHRGPCRLGQRLTLQVVIEPADHRSVHVDGSVFGIDQLTHPVPLVPPPVQPRPDHQFLLPDRPRAALVLSTLEAGD